MSPDLLANIEAYERETGNTRVRELAATRPEYARKILDVHAGLAVTASPPATNAPTLDQWTFVTTARLMADTVDLAATLPPDIDAVVAIARSGLMPGSLIATVRHLPLWTISRQTGLTDPGHGGRMDGTARDEPRHVLLIDDTAAGGREMGANTATVRAHWPGTDITRCAIYCHPAALRQVDRYAFVYPGLHFLEWNWTNAGHGERCGYDFDGILCRDEDERPLYVPRRLPVPLIVTGRHESARASTQAWLDRWGVRVDRLIMRDFDAPDRYDVDRIATFKASHYASSPCVLFAESDPWQAERINILTGKPVLCPKAGRVFPPCRQPARPSVAEQVALLRRVQACPHWSRASCGCEFGVCAVGKGRDGRVTADDCRRCLDGAD